MPPVLAAIPAALAAAAGAGIAGTAFTFGSIALTGWAAAAAYGGLSLALGTAANLLTANGPGQASSPVQPVKLNFAQDSQEQCAWAYGTVTSGGTVKYWKTTGTDNKFLWFVVAFHDSPIDAVLNFYLHGKLETFSGANATGLYSGVMSRYDHLGSETQTVDTNLDAAVAEWTPAHQLRGIAYYVWKLTYDQVKYANGRPDPSIEFRGRRVWDLRKDPDYGGIGSHRLNDELTWEWTDNAALCTLDYVKGIRLNGQFIGGMKCPVAGLDLDSWIAAANVCDQDVSLKAGGTEKRYRIDGMVGSLEDKELVFTSMLQAMAAVPTIRNGKLGITPGAAVVVTTTLTDDDLAGPMTVRPSRSIQEKHNLITAVIYDRLAADGVADVPPLINGNYVAEDGGLELARELRHRFTSSTPTAQRLNKIFLANEREQLSVEALWKPKVAKIPLFGTFLWTSAAAGYTAQKMRVVQRKRQPDGSFQISARQETDAKYNWAQATEEGNPPSFVAHVGFDPSVITAPGAGDVHVDAVTIDGAGGSKIPAFLLTADAPPSSFVTNILTRYKLSSSSEWQTGPAITGVGGSTFVQALAPEVNYDFGFAYQTLYNTSAYTNVSGVLALAWTVTTGMIAPQAVTKHLDASTAASGSVSIPPGPEVAIASASYEASGGRVLVELELTLFSDAPVDPFTLTIRRDGAQVRAFNQFEFTSSASGDLNAALFWADGGAAGTRTWSLGMTDDSGDDRNFVASDVTFTVTDWAR